MKDGVKVDLNKVNVEMLDDGSLEITAMSSLDEGDYHCTASNTNGKAMSISAKLVKAGKLVALVFNRCTGFRKTGQTVV